MFAKCSQCKYVFQVDFQDRLICPVCGSEAVKKEPYSESTTSRPGDTARCRLHPESPATGVCAQCENFVCPECSQAGPNGEPICLDCSTRAQMVGDFPPTPWEQRATLGFFPAFFKTLRLSLFRPSDFFGKMRVDNTKGALSFYWINFAALFFPGIIWNILFTPLTLKNLSPIQISSAGIRVMVTIAGILITWAIMAPAVLYIHAAIVHLGTLLFNCSKNGFNATLRSVAYASSTNWFSMIPICGFFIAYIWNLVLIIIGICKTQRTSVGRAVGAVVVPIFILACCLTSVFLALFPLWSHAANL